MIESGNVYIPSPTLHPWVEDLLNEVTFFPNSSHDDQVDAMSQALRRLVRCAGTGAFKPIRGLFRKKS